MNTNNYKIRKNVKLILVKKKNKHHCESTKGKMTTSECKVGRAGDNNQERV